MSMKTMLIAGGTGLIGRALQARARAEGWTVYTLSRTAGEGRVVWDPARGVIDCADLPPFEVIVNLAGESIAGHRWTPAHKQRVRQSRLDAAGTLHRFVADGLLHTKTYIGASAVGYYGDQGDHLVTELTPSGPQGDWMTSTVLAWEEAHQRMAGLGVRTAILRIGIVLSREGGAFREMQMTAPFGFLTTFGSGRAYIPWIHIEDLANIFLWIARGHGAKGTYVACAPMAVTNKALVQAAASVRRPRKVVFPVPRIVLAILLGEMHRVLFDSCRGVPARLRAEQFTFRFPEIRGAMEDLLGKK